MSGPCQEVVVLIVEYLKEVIEHLCRRRMSSLLTAKYLAKEQDTLHILVDTLGWGQLFVLGWVLLLGLFSSLTIFFENIFSIYTDFL